MKFSFTLHAATVWHAGKVGPETRDFRNRDPGPSTWDHSPGTQDSGPICGTRDPEPLHGTVHLAPITWDTEPSMLDSIKKTYFVYHSIVFCVVFILIYSLEFSSQFLIFAKLI